MFASCIIPTRNRYQNLKHTLEALQNQTLDRSEYEIIISDDNSEDETFSLYKEYSQKGKIKYINNNTKPHTWNASIPRNLAAAVSDPDTKVFIFIDSDVVLPSAALQHYKEDYEHNPKRVVIAPYDFMDKDGHTIQVADVRNLKFETVKPEEVFDTATDGLACFGGNLMIPKEIFWDVGGYDPLTHIGLEDGEMGLRLWKKKTKFSYDNRIRGKHTWHEISPDRFPPDMKEHIDRLNLKHFNTKDPDYGIIETSRDAYASWGIEGWVEPPQWRRMQVGLTINKV